MKPGYIITANHVVAGEDSVRVQREDGTTIFNAKVLWHDPTHDLAAVAIPVEWSNGTSPLACSYKPKAGDHVEAVGNPMGALFVHTWGRIAGTQQSVEGMFAKDAILKNWPEVYLAQIVIAPGNSGGPLFNERGEVVGINVGIMLAPGKNPLDSLDTGLAFVVPASTVCADIKAHEGVS